MNGDGQYKHHRNSLQIKKSDQDNKNVKTAEIKVHNSNCEKVHFFFVVVTGAEKSSAKTSYNLLNLKLFKMVAESDCPFL